MLFSLNVPQLGRASVPDFSFLILTSPVCLLILLKLSLELSEAQPSLSSPQPWLLLPPTQVSQPSIWPRDPRSPTSSKSPFHREFFLSLHCLFRFKSQQWLLGSNQDSLKRRGKATSEFTPMPSSQSSPAIISKCTGRGSDVIVRVPREPQGQEQHQHTVGALFFLNGTSPGKPSKIPSGWVRWGGSYLQVHPHAL